MSAVSDSTLGALLIECHESVSSTQTRAAQLAKEGVPNALVVALAQTAGRGRLAREWKSALGTGIYFSITSRPTSIAGDAYLVNIIAAIAVADAVRSVLGTDIRIKWPNDLLIKGNDGEWGKVCGILSESSFRGGSLDYCVTGIGINLRRPESDENFRVKAGWLFDGDSPDERTLALLLSGIVSSFFGGLDSLAKTGSDSLLKRYRSQCASIGQVIDLETDSEKLTGLCVGVGSGGEMLLKTPDGVRGFYVGDVVHATMKSAAGSAV